MPDQLTQAVSVNALMGPKDEFSQEVLVLLLRELIDSSRSTASTLATLTSSVADINLKMSDMDTAEVKVEVREIAGRLAVLERAATERTGMMKLVASAKDYGGWFLGILTATVFYLVERARR